MGKSGLIPGKQETVGDVFRRFDADGSGSLSVEELTRVLTRPGGGSPLSEEEVRAIVEQFDSSGDGELQLDEFMAMWGFNDRGSGTSGSSSSWFTRFAFRVPGARGSPVGRRPCRAAAPVRCRATRTAAAWRLGCGGCPPRCPARCQAGWRAATPPSRRRLAGGPRAARGRRRRERR